MTKNYTDELITEQEIKNSFCIKSLNKIKVDDPSVRRLFYHRIYFLTGCEGAIRIDGRVFQLSGKELFLLSRGQTFSLQLHSRLSGYELSFGDCFWDRAPASASNCKAVLFNNAAANQQLPVGDDDHDDLDILFRALYQEFAKGDYLNKLDAMAAYLKIIMIKIANIKATLIERYDSHAKQLYRQFVDLVQYQCQTSRDVAEYASQLNISSRKLSDICKECSGQGAKEIINNQIIAEAKRSLQFSTKPVKEIAFDLNFHTPEQFSHFFKTHARVSPLLYRENFVNIGM